ncbi:uncharacterized protein Sting isoform X2 [Periplaneta americana]
MGFTALLLIVGTMNVLYVDGYGGAMRYLVVASAIGTFTVGIFHLFKRTCLVLEELNHIPGRYHDRYSIFSNTYMFNRLSLIFFGLSFLYVIWHSLSFGNPYTYLWNKGPLSNMLSYMFGISFCSLIDMASEPQKCNSQTDNVLNATTEEMNDRVLTLEAKVANIMASQMDVLKTEIFSRIEIEVQKRVSEEVEKFLTTLNATSIAFGKEQEQTEKEDSITQTSLQIEKMKSLDYGSGMAYNYFYGYLRLVLPDPEIGVQAKDTNGILKRIETFINHHHLSEENFPVKKLFILIPQSLRTPTDLKADSTDYPDNTKYWMEAAVSLESQELDRAGVKQRVYKNSVYKIKDWENPTRKPVYVVAEGATPLKTLYDVIKMNPKMSRIFKNHQPEIVSAFYKTLLEIISYTDDCKDVCEIIYYVDTDEHGRKVNIARIILERIRELESRGNPMAAANDNW